MAPDAQSEARINNFDAIRLLAALFVIITHSFAFLGLPEHDALHVASRGFLSFSRLGLYTFFALSGYLVCGSLLRSESLVHFFRNRSLRIFPGLFAVVLFTVLLFGPFVTTLPISRYFASSETWSYLQTLTLYRVEYTLPGVFERNPYPLAVNGSLWTLAYEFTLYFILVALMFFGKSRLRNTLIATILTLFALRLVAFEVLSSVTLPVLRLNLGHLLNFALYFLMGAAASYLPTTLFRSRAFASFMLTTTLISFWTPLAPFFLYITIPALLLSLGHAALPRFRELTATGDYSYGFYVYAFPIGQILAAWLAPLHPHPYTLAALTILATAPFAVASWHFIEQPALALKSKKH